jgi:hypothetical protein
VVSESVPVDQSGFVSALERGAYSAVIRPIDLDPTKKGPCRALNAGDDRGDAPRISPERTTRAMGAFLLLADEMGF